MSNLNLSSFQNSIIDELAGKGDPVRIERTEHRVHALLLLEPTGDKSGARDAIRISFEEDVVVYILVGTISNNGYFYSNGSEAVLSNMSDKVIKAAVKALLGR